VAALDTLINAYINDGAILVLLATAYLIVVVAVEGLLLTLLRLFRRGQSLLPIGTAILATINLVSFKLVFSSELLALANPAKAVLLLFFCAIFLLLIKQSWAAQRRILLFLSIALGAYSLLQPLIPRPSSTNPPALSTYEDIRLMDRPNIHVIAFDSMIPAAIATQYLGIRPSYQSFLEEHALVFRNAFSVNVPTEPSINGFLRLDDDRFDDGGEYFAGRQLSPVFAVFKKNGYTVATGFSSSYFGPQGQYVDIYRTATDHRGIPFPLKGTTLCLDGSSRFLTIPKFFRLCKIKALDAAGKRFFNISHTAGSWPASVKSIIGNTSQSRPVFSFHYIFEPIGHTAKSFDSNDKRQLQEYSDYFAGKAKEITAYLEELKAEVLKSDPNAIVIVFGDHGAWLSRSATYEADQRFFMLDRHAVSLSVLKTENRCVNNRKFIDNYLAGYSTPSRLLAGIIRCNAVDKATVDGAVNFSESYSFGNLKYE
jgi:hypothetical protein